MPASRSDSLFEREGELAALAAAVEYAGRGDGRLVVVEGTAGIGKTRLLRWVREHAASDGNARVLSARGAELEAHLAFGVVRQLLDPLVLALDGAERDDLFTGAARLARAVVGDAVPNDDSPAADRYSKVNGLYWLINTLARRKPVVVVVDDAQ